MSQNKTKAQYKISIDYDDYFANSSTLKATNLLIVGDSIMFYTDKETLNVLEAKDIRYMLHQNPKERFTKIFKYKTGIIVGIFIIAFMIVMNSFRVSAINFSGDYPVNDEIANYINAQNKQILSFNFHKNNYQDLAKNLRSVFNEYEWISVEKKGSVVYVTIEPTTVKKMEDEDDVKGDIVATKSGLVTEYKVFNGVTNIKTQQYIKSGDILISGANSKAKGYVLATVYEEKIFIVNKESSSLELSGQAIYYNQISLFKKTFDINKKQDYIISDKKNKTVFSIPYIFSINKIEEYEKSDIIYTYDKKAAINYATSIIEDDFSQNKVLNEEKILKIEVVTVLETESSFEIKFMVKKIESIGEFKSRI